jgi:hypothetical protein
MRGRLVAAAVLVASLAAVCVQNVSAEEDGGGDSKTLRQKFSKWLRKHGVNDGNVKLVDEDERGWGRGIVARRAIKEGDLLFNIPLKWCVYNSRAHAHEHAPQKAICYATIQQTHNTDTQQRIMTRTQIVYCTMHTHFACMIRCTLQLTHTPRRTQISLHLHAARRACLCVEEQKSQKGTLDTA